MDNPKECEIYKKTHDFDKQCSGSCGTCGKNYQEAKKLIIEKCEELLFVIKYLEKIDNNEGIYFKETQELLKNLYKEQ